MIAYTVFCTFEDAEVSRAWERWLLEEHLADVCEAGALHAELFRGCEETITYEVRYRFRDREAFATYEREHAPRLRTEGLNKFPLSLGLRYERRVAEIVGEHP